MSQNETPGASLPKNILLTNLSMTSRSGTETHARDLALRLRKSPFHISIYSPLCGDLAEELRGQGIMVVDNLDDLPFTPDLIHGHHHVETMTALLRYPDTPGIFVCHDGSAWHDKAPEFPRILRYVGVDLRCKNRLIKDLGTEGSVSVIHNSVDLDRFPKRSPLPESPKRAVLFSHYASSDTHLPWVKAACDQAGISLEVIGNASGNPVSAPESILGNFDLVFGKARCAMEAMAVGCAVVLIDPEGCGPLVSPANFERLRPLNFGRLACDQKLSPEAILTQLEQYSPENAQEVCRLAREKLSLDFMANSLTDLYAEVLAEWESGKADREPENHFVSRYLSGHFDYLWMAQAKQAAAEIAHWKASAEAAHQGWADLSKEIETRKKTRTLTRRLTDWWPRHHGHSDPK